VLLLHGNGGSAADLDDVSGLSELADRRGFLAVYPQGLSVGAGRPFWAAAGRVEWATRDGCPGDAAVFLNTAEVTGVRWGGCRDGAEVVHYRINGGTHQAPRTIDGRSFAQVVWDFFAAHQLPG
jgi:poly(3-hydroxybutyrate) depolymerase